MDWEIQELSKFCLECKENFSQGADFYTFLSLTAENKMSRNDLCLKCAETLRSSWNARPDLYSCWQGKYSFETVEVKAQPLPYERFEAALRRYIVSQEARDQKFTYVLALLLERKKILIHRESIIKDEEKKNFLVYEHSQTGESFVVEDPRLSLSQVDEFQKELKDLLAQEFQPELSADAGKGS